MAYIGIYSRGERQIENLLVAVNFIQQSRAAFDPACNAIGRLSLPKIASPKAVVMRRFRRNLSRYRPRNLSRSPYSRASSPGRGGERTREKERNRGRGEIIARAPCQLLATFLTFLPAHIYLSSLLNTGINNAETCFPPGIQAVSFLRRAVEKFHVCLRRSNFAPYKTRPVRRNYCRAVAKISSATFLTPGHRCLHGVPSE